MSVIRIDPAQVEGTGSQFITKGGELEALVSQAKGMMNNLQGQFTGQRAQKIFSEWESMQGNLRSAVGTLEQAGNLLKRAASDFSRVDMGG
jgi:WXG100 family type VII secretion target